MRERLPAGPLIVVAAAAGLLLVSLGTWYRVELGEIPGGRAAVDRFVQQGAFATRANAWEPWGIGSDLLLALVIGGALALAAGALTGALRGPVPALCAIALAALGTGLTLEHVLNEPSPAQIVAVRPAAWLGLTCCVAMLGGGFLWWDRAVHPPPER